MEEWDELFGELPDPDGIDDWLAVPPSETSNEWHNSGRFSDEESEVDGNDVIRDTDVLLSRVLSKRSSSPSRPLVTVPLPPVTICLKALRKRGKHHPWSESSSVNFSKAHRVGKSRKLFLNGDLPNAWKENLFIQVQVLQVSNNEPGYFCVTKKELPSAEDRQPVPLLLPFALPLEVFLHFASTKNSTKVDEHYVVWDIYSPSGDIVTSFQFGGIFPAGHKYETGKKQKIFYKEQDSQLEITLPSGAAIISDLKIDRGIPRGIAKKPRKSRGC